VVEAALQMKRVPYRRFDLPPVVHRPVMRAAFGGATVPGVRFADGRRVLGSRPILRELEARVAEPPLRLGDPDVAAAEAWGEEVLQPLTRRLVWGALDRQPSALTSYAVGARPPVPAIVTRGLAWAVVRAENAIHGKNPSDRRDLEGHLARVDAWIAAGLLGGAQPNAADLQIAASVRILLTLDELAPQIDRRPAGALARRVFPDYPGRVAAASA
jgi:glutathione S-transferase